MTLAAAFAAAPDRQVLLVEGRSRVSSGELESQVRAVAASMAARGVEPGQPVAFQLPVGVASVVAYRACWHIGAVAVALHPAAGADQLAQALDQSRPGLTIAGSGFGLARMAGSVTMEDLLDGPGVGSGTDPGAAATMTEAGVGVGTDSDDALVIFTSGSTGLPRGVVHTHRGLLYKIVQLMKTHGLTRADTALIPSPLAHVAGLLHGVLIPGAAGMKTVLMDRWDPGVALEVIEQESVTYMVGPPTMFMGLMDHPELDPGRVESLRLISCGGAGVTPSFCERARAALGAVVKRSYGSTEAPTVATSGFDDPPDKMITTDGRAFGETRLRVDAEGELWVSGPELARGYLDSEATARVFVDGWFRTGDLAAITDGWVTITGRLGDRIIRSGENISAIEVERHLEAHPYVRQAVAVAEPDERLGERVAAFVVAPEGFGMADCRDWFSQQGAARYIVPERIEVVEELPVLESGKVDRVKLVARLRQRPARQEQEAW